MAVSDSEFAHLVAKTSADHRDLERGMRQGEQVVRDSGKRMQNSLGAVSTSGAQTGKQMDKTAASTAALGAAGQVMGGQLGAAAGQIQAATGALAMLNVEISPTLIAAGAAILAVMNLINKLREAQKIEEEMQQRAADIITARLEAENKARRAAGIGTEIGSRADAMRMEAREIARTTEEYANLLDQVKKFEEAEYKALAVKKEQGLHATLREARDRLRVERGTATALDIKVEAMERELETMMLSEEEHKRMLGLIDAYAIAERELARVQDEKADREKAQAQRDAARARALAEIAEIEGRITSEIEAEDEAARQLIRSQEDRNVALAQQVAIAAGLAKSYDFIADPRQRDLLKTLERLQGGGAASASFTFGTRGAEGFRFGGPTGEERFGEQREDIKQTQALTSIDEGVKRAVEYLRQWGHKVDSVMALN